MGLTLFCCTHKDTTLILHIQIKTVIFFQTKIMKISLEPTLTCVAKLEVDTNADHTRKKRERRHKMFLDHKGLTTGKASCLGGKLLHCGRRVEQQNYWCETIGSHGGQEKSESWKGGANGEGIMKTKKSKIYHLQKGRDAQVRWSSVCAGLCIRLPSLRSSVDDALQMGHTAKQWWVENVSVFLNHKQKSFLKFYNSILSYLKRHFNSTERRYNGKNTGMNLWIWDTLNQHILAHLTEEWHWVLPLVHGTLASFVPTSLLLNPLHHPEERKRNRSLVKSRLNGKTLLAHMQQAKREHSSSKKLWQCKRMKAHPTVS